LVPMAADGKVIGSVGGEDCYNRSDGIVSK
jgi:hypothetical protein